MLKTIEKVLMLQEFDLFRSVTTEHLAQLAELCEERVVKQGEIVFQGAEPLERLFLLVRGSVQLVSDGGKVEEIQCAPLNLVPFFSQRSADTTAKAVQESVLLCTPKETLHDLLAGEPELSLSFLRHVAELSSQDAPSVNKSPRSFVK